MVEFWLCFVPLFVAVDALGVLPIFITLTEGFGTHKTHRIIVQSVLTALIVAILFLALGRFIFRLLGITVADFMIAGGMLLFIISLNDILSVEKQQRRVDPESLGAVPLGVPIIVGPAVLTTIILLVNEYGLFPTISATIANIMIVGFVFWLSEPINLALGKTGTKAISKLTSLILAAIAIMMVRKGIMTFIEGAF